MAEDLSRLLAAITELWHRQINLSEERKKKDFGNAAREIMRYVGKRYERIGIEPVVDGVPVNRDTYLTVANYTQAAIDILTPYIFAKVPNRLVQPRRPQIPPELEQAIPEIVQMQAATKQQDTMLCFLLQWVLNWWPKIYNLTREGKMVVQEAIAKGRGTLWLTVRDGPEGTIPASEASSVDNFGIDADARQLRDAGFIYRRWDLPAYRIAEMWGEDVEKIRSSATSSSQQWQAVLGTVPDSFVDPNVPKKGDIATYFEVWSRIGMGDTLLGTPDELKNPSPFRDAIKQAGPYLHFAIMPGLDHPLGISIDKLANLQQLVPTLQAMLEWPIKTYENMDNPWPVFCLDFKPNIDNPWARSILESALPLQDFIDRIYRSLMHRAKTAGRDICLCSDALEDAVKDALEGGEDNEMVPVAGSVSKEKMDELVHFLQFPEVKKDIFEILQWCDRVFRELTGLDPAQFGGVPTSQDRSAKASSLRQQGMARRPDDYADTVEQWMSSQSSGEGLVARLMVGPDSVAPIFGEPILDITTGQPATPNTVEQNKHYGPLTTYWMQLVHTDDPAVAAAECSYTVEAGSGRRRNKQLLQENAQRIFEMFSQQCYSILEGTGESKPFTILAELVGQAYDMPLQPLIDSINEVFTRIAQQKQQSDQVAQGGQGGGEEEPGAPGTQANKTMAGGGVLARRWQAAAGSPHSQGKLGPPPDSQ